MNLPQKVVALAIIHEQKIETSVANEYIQQQF